MAGFYLRNKSCVLFTANQRLASATFMPLIDYSDVLYMHGSS